MKQPEFNFDEGSTPPPQPPPPREETAPKREASATILARIKKLLRLAADKRGNPHEAERAAELAFELASKHHVDLAGMDLDDELEGVVMERMRCGQRIDQLRDRVLGILITFFHVEVCISKPDVIFTGRATDIQIARYVHDFLLRCGRDCLRAYEAREKRERRRMTPVKRSSYIAGFCYGISANLRLASDAFVLEDSKAALVLADKAARQVKMDEAAPQRKERKRIEGRKNRGALLQGWDAGQKTQINKPLGRNTGEVLALEGGV